MTKPRLGPWREDSPSGDRLRFFEEDGSPDLDSGKHVVCVIVDDRMWYVFEGRGAHQLAKAKWSSDDVDEACAEADRAASQWYEIPDGPHRTAATGRSRFPQSAPEELHVDLDRPVRPYDPYYDDPNPEWDETRREAFRRFILGE